MALFKIFNIPTMNLAFIVAIAVTITSAKGPNADDDPYIIKSRRFQGCGYDSCTDYDRSKLNIHVVPHTHNDLGWVQTIDEYYYGYGARHNSSSAPCRSVRRILNTVIQELWKNPKRKFVYVETAFFWKWWVEQRRYIKNKVKTLVRQGRLQFAGGAWSMNDEAVTHYQSIIDQFTLGLSRLNQTFGECGRPLVGWQIDPFGHSREFASLLAAMGYDGLFLGRIDYQDKNRRLRTKTMEMVWRGDDNLGKGSDIFTGVLFNHYVPIVDFGFEKCPYSPHVFGNPIENTEVEQFIKAASNAAKHYRTNNILLTMGDDFSYSDAISWYSKLDQLILAIQKRGTRVGFKINAFYSTPTCYMAAVRQANPTLPVKRDDFFPYASEHHAYWTGYFTSRPTVKFLERRANAYLQMFKQLQVLADLDGNNRIIVSKLKSAVGIMQHHDAITGTSKQYVTRDHVNIVNSAIEGGLIIARQAYNKYMKTDSNQRLNFVSCLFNESSCETTERSSRYIVTVYNPLAWHVTEAIRIPVRHKLNTVYGPNGDIVKHQMVDIPKKLRSTADFDIVFFAYLEPVSYTSFYIQKTSHSKRVTPVVHRHHSLKDNWVNITKKSNMKPYYNNATPNNNNKLRQVNKVTPNNDKAIHNNNATFNDNKTLTHVDNATPNDNNNLTHVNNATPNDNNNLTHVNNVTPQVDNVTFLFDNLPIHQDSIDELNNLQMVTKESETVERLRFPMEQFEQFDEEQLSEIYRKKRCDCFLMKNEHLKIHFNNNGIVKIVKDKLHLEIKINFYYYKSVSDISVVPSSGAYIFRPQDQNPIKVIPKMYSNTFGPLVKEIRFQYSENAYSILRLYKGANYLEHEWMVGPVNINDYVGKEIVVRYETNIKNKGVFFTDSNGRQMIKRRLNNRPTWKLTLKESVAGNYYPVTNRIYVNDDHLKTSILTDRSEGGTSPKSGTVELMLHRRILRDDNKGVMEALNEYNDRAGLVVRGRHRVFVTDVNKTDRVEENKHIFQFHLQPIILVANAENVTIEDWIKLNNFHSFVNALPDGIHLLTVEPWYITNTFLLRLENYLEKTDGTKAIISVDLKSIFKNIKVLSYRETTLAANQFKNEYKQWKWNIESSFPENDNLEYKRYVVNSNREPASAPNHDFVIVMNPKQIRTFLVQYEFLQPN